MKLRIKIVLLTALLLLMAVIVFTLFYLLYRNDPLNRTANALPEVNGSELFSEVDPPDAQRNFQRRTVQLALPEQSVERYGLAGEVEAAEVAVNFGNTIAVVLDFIIIAFAVFCMVKALNNLHRKKEEPAPQPEPEPAPPAPTTEELLAEIRDLLKNK